MTLATTLGPAQAGVPSSPVRRHDYENRAGQPNSCSAEQMCCRTRWDWGRRAAFGRRAFHSHLRINRRTTNVIDSASATVRRAERWDITVGSDAARVMAGLPAGSPPLYLRTR